MDGVEVLSPVQGRVRSSRDENTWYAVSLEGTDFCTCEGYKYRHRCRHIDLFREALNPPGQMVLVPEPTPERTKAQKGFAIYTSRYQARDKVIASGCTPVGVTVGVPRFSLPYRYHMVKELAPTGLTRVDDENEFTRLYTKRLDAIGVDKIRERLVQAGHGGPVVLLCFEDTDKDFCHRTVFARWWKQKTGEDVREL